MFIDSLYPLLSFFDFCVPFARSLGLLNPFQSLATKMSGTLESYVNRPVSVITADGRNFIGKAASVTAAKRLVLCCIAIASTHGYGSEIRCSLPCKQLLWLICWLSLVFNRIFVWSWTRLIIRVRFYTVAYPQRALKKRQDN